MTQGACFKRLPPEWLRPETQSALERLSKKASDWFERLVADFLSLRGVEGRKCKDEVQGSGSAIPIPPDVGEIDFLGFLSSERLLVIAECKMVEDRTEPKFWRDDLAEFVTQRDSYEIKFLKKINWVSHQKKQIVRLFKSYPGGAYRVAPVLLTLNPHFVGQLVTNFRCVSLAEFLMDFDAAGKWPYELLDVTTN